MSATCSRDPSAAESANVADAKRAATIRVLHVINGEHYAGAERVQDHLALRLPAYGFEVDFACVKPDRFGPLRQSRQAEMHDVPMQSRWDDLKPFAKQRPRGKFNERDLARAMIVRLDENIAQLALNGVAHDVTVRSHNFHSQHDDFSCRLRTKYF